jgi:hypothetical protein
MATARDAAAVMSVYLEAWRAGYHGLLGDDELEAQARMRASYDWFGAITQNGRIVAVAEDERIVGSSSASTPRRLDAGPGFTGSTWCPQRGGPAQLRRC